VIQYGLGDIGSACARAVAATRGLALAGAVDVHPAKAGLRLAEILGAGRDGRLRGVRVFDALSALLRTTRADVVLHTTRSSLAEVAPQIEECVRAGLDVVSSTEELSLPAATQPALARRLDRAARAGGASILGTGVNPGFVMDLLPIVAAGASRNVRRVRVERVLDAGTRRASFQRKVGVGMTAEEARRRLREGGFGHVGLRESALIVAAGCDLHPEEIRETSHPILAARTLPSALGPIRRGRVAGLHQSLAGMRDGEEILRFDMVMAVGVKDPHDAAFIEADPPVRLRLEGGIPGDAGTVGVLLNAIPRVMDAAPGLHTLLDLPVPRPWRPR
jgi:4-hydroxy-tetrahydrodipicolinate reductase